MSNEHELYQSLKLAPNFVDSHHPHRIPMLLVAMAETIEFGAEYARQIIINAKSLGKHLYREGFKVLYKELGFTESHTVLVDVSEFGDGKSIATELEKINIIVNKMQVPEDMIKERRIPTGIRIGVQEMTRFGMKEEDMKEIASFFRRLIDKENTNKIQRDAIELRNRHQKIQYCFEK